MNYFIAIPNGERVDSFGILYQSFEAVARPSVVQSYVLVKEGLADIVVAA
jgi:hypothetical protein